MAVPVCLGYLLAHGSAHQRRELAGASWHQRLLQALGARAIWLTASLCLMLAALVASLSRAGMVGLISGILVAAYLRGRRAGSPPSLRAIAAPSPAAGPALL